MNFISLTLLFIHTYKLDHWVDILITTLSIYLVRDMLGCRKLVLLGIFNLPVFDFTKYDVYYLLDLRNCAEI